MTASSHAELESVRAELAQIDGIEGVYIDESRKTFLLVCEPTASDPAEPLARALFRKHPGTSAYRLEFAYASPTGARRRVRLVDVAVEPKQGTLNATVTLEWQDRLFSRSVAAVEGPIGGVRAVGEATIGALGEIIGARMRFHLTGVKTSRVYDEEIVLALLHIDVEPTAALVGVASAGTSINYAAARAVLSACNRLLGNYLETTD